MVLRWDGAPQDVDKEVVILDTDPSPDAFAGFDAYDDRSLIENTCNREAKESWWLERHPKRSEAGVRVHAYFVFTCMALVTALRLHQQAAEAAEQRGEETGIGRFRRQLEARSRDKVIVFLRCALRDFQEPRGLPAARHPGARARAPGRVGADGARALACEGAGHVVTAGDGAACR